MGVINLISNGLSSIHCIGMTFSVLRLINNPRQVSYSIHHWPLIMLVTVRGNWSGVEVIFASYRPCLSGFILSWVVYTNWGIAMLLLFFLPIPCNNFFFFFFFLFFRCVAFSLSAIYAGLLYGLYVPDWQFKVSPGTSLLPSNDSSVYLVRASRCFLLKFCLLFCSRSNKFNLFIN